MVILKSFLLYGIFLMLAVNESFATSLADFTASSKSAINHNDSNKLATDNDDLLLLVDNQLTDSRKLLVVDGSRRFEQIVKRINAAYGELFINTYNKQKRALFFYPLVSIMKLMREIRKNHTNDTHATYCDEQLAWKKAQFEVEYQSNPHRCHVNAPYLNLVSMYFAIKFSADYNATVNPMLSVNASDNFDKLEKSLDAFVGTFDKIELCRADLFKWKKEAAVKLFEDTIECYNNGVQSVAAASMALTAANSVSQWLNSKLLYAIPMVQFVRFF